MYMSSGVPESGERTEEISEGIMDENISKFDENHKLTDPEAQQINYCTCVWRKRHLEER